MEMQFSGALFPI